MTTYIYEGMEVELTGRKASKKRKRASSKADPLIIFEIKARDDKIEFITWVSMEDLFEVVE